MASIQPFTGQPTGQTISCELASFGVVQASQPALPALRQAPFPPNGERLPAALLKHADEQTVAGLAAVFQAIQQSGQSISAFRDWGVVAASRFLGRTITAQAVQRFRTEGAWGISPHLVPHRSLHSLSGTISQVLKIHGPNLGAGGGPAGLVDALLAAGALIRGAALPGIWIVLTGWLPELACDLEGRSVTPDSICLAIALMLTSTVAGAAGFRLRMTPRGTPHDLPSGSGSGVEQGNLLTLEGLARTLTVPDTPGSSSVVWCLPGGGWIELQRRARSLHLPANGPAAIPAA